VSYAQASEDLGIHPTQLRNWVKQAAITDALAKNQPQCLWDFCNSIPNSGGPGLGYSHVVLLTTTLWAH
jgi:hypothetical protein